ncbi:MAG: hypothetical protein JW958_07290 [Candidatus Eisenbacteria bacterium]|nr:hypothetical protein [Candidatus Eisenbacteria bacterium]
MRKNAVLKILNPILGLLLLNQLLTGLSRGGLPSEAFETLHEGGGIALAVVAVLHVYMNRNWIRAHYFRKGLVVKPDTGPE